ncbi:N-acetylmuramoyl-L-alanine amidase [Ornithinibacillus scapharcae]|uniref:N-acetylmuramoyl-L-alanine amidase n=1 Tax=Ornithinibacillus scapharcae TaxID=1147159 RepID=UPI000225BBF2|nr:N-acetylmuramoyl-L-alanine amidase [Ornithinibacillus scapharcae]
MKIVIHSAILYLIILIVIPSPRISAKEIYHSGHDLLVHQMYLPIDNSEPRNEEVTTIVIHSISNVLANPDSPYRITDVYQLLKEYGLSTHYIIDRSGEIFQLVPDYRVAYHAGRSSFPYLPFFPHNMNQFSIGIELMGIGTKDEMLSIVPEALYDALDKNLIGYTEEQYQSLSWLLAQLHQKYPSIGRDRFHVIGHEEYAPGRKSDPGKLFHWEKIFETK